MLPFRNLSNYWRHNLLLPSSEIQIIGTSSKDDEKDDEKDDDHEYVCAKYGSRPPFTDKRGRENVNLSCCRRERERKQKKLFQISSFTIMVSFHELQDLFLLSDFRGCLNDEELLLLYEEYN